MINSIKDAFKREEARNFENRLIHNSYDEDAEETRIERAARLISPIKPLNEENNAE